MRALVPVVAVAAVACHGSHDTPKHEDAAHQAAKPVDANIDAPVAVVVDAEATVPDSPGKTGTKTVWIDNRGAPATVVAAGDRSVSVEADAIAYLVVPEPTDHVDVLVGGKRVGSIGRAPGESNVPDFILDVTGHHCYVRDVAQYNAHAHPFTGTPGETNADVSERIPGGKLRRVWGPVEDFIEPPPRTVEATYSGEQSRIFVADCAKR